MKISPEFDILKLGHISHNQSVDELMAIALQRGEGTLTTSGSLACLTGEFTGRSPKDKYIVENAAAASVNWGIVNQRMSAQSFDLLLQDQLAYLATRAQSGGPLHVQDLFGGADATYRSSIRVVTETAWASLFCKQLLIRPRAIELVGYHPDFTIIQTPGFRADPARHQVRSSTCIALDFERGLVLIVGTSYAGEMKKSVFTILNYLLPLQGVLSMHCSANIAAQGDQNPVLFFGLSGTGKTTLSADPKRRLVGDDEHGWSENGIFNFEGGCYAKCVNLDPNKEPQIWGALRRGTILENVFVDPTTGEPDYRDTRYTENTRAAYPIDYIDAAVLEGTAAHPRHIIFLTCDAFGVLPPIAKLSTPQAMYHFLSGYTAKIAGTERGLGNTPEVTFSTCFGSPFLPLKPAAYAKLLGEKLARSGAQCWLVNTGWSGGPFGEGSRIDLGYTRAMIRAAIEGDLDSLGWKHEAIFGLQVPAMIPGVPTSLLEPRTLWPNVERYDAQAKDLVARFKQNFSIFEADVSREVTQAGPK